jgi:hypothetical protein
VGHFVSQNTDFDYLTQKYAMKKIYLFVVLCSATALLRAQVAYYDVMELKTLLRTQMVWDRTEGSLNDTSAPVSAGQLAEEREYPYLIRTKRNDTIANKVRFYKFNSSKVTFSTSEADRKKVSAILKKYYYGGETDNKTYFENLIKRDSLFLKFIPANYTAGGSGATGVSAFLSGIGNMDVTALADGLAQFLVERGKDELNVAFFQRFENFLSNYPEIKTLFPNTSAFLENFKFWEYANLLNTLREAFDKDLKELMKHTAGLGELDPGMYCGISAADTAVTGTFSRAHGDMYNQYLLHRYNVLTAVNGTKDSLEKVLKKFVTDNTTILRPVDLIFAKGNSTCTDRLIRLHIFLQKDEGRYLIAGLKIADGAISGAKVPDIIHDIAGARVLGGLTGPSQADLKTVYRFTDILSYSLRSNEKSRNYISHDQLVALFSDNATRDLYFALIYLQAKNESLALTVGGVTYQLADDVIAPLGQSATTAENAKTYLDSLIIKAERFRVSVVEVRKAQKAELKELTTKTGDMFVDFQDLLDQATNISSIDARLVLPPLVNDITELTSSTLAIAHDLAVRNYNAAVFGLLNTLQKTADVICKKNPDACNSKPVQFMSSFLKYGSFAANVVTAKDPADVKNAIKAVALPSGSAAVKKHSWFNISLQAYVGLTSGRNFYFKDTSTVISYTQTGLDTPTNTYRFKADTSRVANPKSTPIAIHAPIGLSFNWGLGPRMRHPWSVSLFVPLIDVGALVGFRLNDKTDSSNNYRKIESDNIKIRLSNLFSPGCALTIGFPDAPISVMAYWQWIPTLQRDNSSNSLQFYDKTGFRVGGSLVMDLPMLNLFTTKMDEPKAYQLK